MRPAFLPTELPPTCLVTYVVSFSDVYIVAGAAFLTTTFELFRTVVVLVGEAELEVYVVTTV